MQDLNKELNELRECKSKIKQLVLHVQECSRLNDKAIQYADRLRFFASFDNYLLARACHKDLKKEMKIYDAQCEKFSKRNDIKLNTRQ